MQEVLKQMQSQQRVSHWATTSYPHLKASVTVDIKHQLVFLALVLADRAPGVTLAIWLKVV